MKIQSLLNPFDCSDRHGERISESPPPANMPRPVDLNTPAQKRQKVPKDAAIFTDAKVNGPVNFPPYEVGDNEELAAHHREHKVYPMGQIQERGARRIPYASGKKEFTEKTGRDAFEVFQYEFCMPGVEKPWSVLWDYQVGLVRMTPFFKCLKYSKTTPAKVMNVNPGLHDICHSITGGSLTAQGYWMPYKAAKAVAATFCYNIRHLLTPVFGNDFLDICTHPNEPSFGKFVIDPEIVRECTIETNGWRANKGQPSATTTASRALTAPVMATVPSTPQTKLYCSPWGNRTSKPQHARRADPDQESGYGTDENGNEKFWFSPEVSPRSHTWTAVNRSVSPLTRASLTPPQRRHPVFKLPQRALVDIIPAEGLLAPVPEELVDEQFRAKRTLSKVAYDDEGAEELRPQTSSTMSVDIDSEPECVSKLHSRSEVDAAEILLSLKATENALHRAKRTRRGSAY
ncbi:hypothetical protein K491DRAFT_706309 [Lophiostoma macrostomum CBS 122681]|uniref:HTH APSES-type domain-containing protein n=1 Tax=Lophiostoma macrostomum CBS 122681 TaxID=1314788 RepID=A0A6A6SYD1_9PLEO|nr:hypothetical protein K491DRAFT_706309 [Lophiostoma macrostomum CBS 122681]